MKVYRCSECNKVFLFEVDLCDHTRDTNHSALHETLELSSSSPASSSAHEPHRDLTLSPGTVAREAAPAWSECKDSEIIIPALDWALDVLGPSTKASLLYYLSEMSDNDAGSHSNRNPWRSGSIKELELALRPLIGNGTKVIINRMVFKAHEIMALRRKDDRG